MCVCVRARAEKTNSDKQAERERPIQGERFRSEVFSKFAPLILERNRPEIAIETTKDQHEHDREETRGRLESCEFVLIGAAQDHSGGFSESRERARQSAIAQQLGKTQSRERAPSVIVR